MDHFGWLEFDGDLGGQDEGSETDFRVVGGDGQFGGELEDYGECVAPGDDVGRSGFDGMPAGFEGSLVLDGAGVEGWVFGERSGDSGN